MTMIFILLVVFQIKHFVADYPLQGKYMMGKFQGGFKWILPLTAHAGVHLFFTTFISLFFVEPKMALLIGAFDFVIHFAMDRIKASPKLLGRHKALSANEYYLLHSGRAITGAGHPEGELKIGFISEPASAAKLESNKLFWFSLGLDQAVHHLTHYAIIYFLVVLS